MLLDGRDRLVHGAGYGQDRNVVVPRVLQDRVSDVHEDRVVGPRGRPVQPQGMPAAGGHRRPFDHDQRVARQPADVIDKHRPSSQ